MLIGPKQGLNQHGSSFVTFFDDFERESARTIVRLSSI